MPIRASAICTFPSRKIYGCSTALLSRRRRIISGPHSPVTPTPFPAFIVAFAAAGTKGAAKSAVRNARRFIFGSPLRLTGVSRLPLHFHFFRQSQTIPVIHLDQDAQFFPRHSLAGQAGPCVDLDITDRLRSAHTLLPSCVQFPEPCPEVLSLFGYLRLVRVLVFFAEPLVVLAPGEDDLARLVLLPFPWGLRSFLKLVSRGLPLCDLGDCGD